MPGEPITLNRGRLIGLSYIRGGENQEPWQSNPLKVRMNKYHIHVYPIEGMVELDILASSEIGAKERALTIMLDSEDFYQGEYPVSDCRYITICPEDGNEEARQTQESPYI